MVLIERKKTIAKGQEKRYKDLEVYREPLRRDFHWTCGYCQVWESQANGSSSFWIEHFISRAEAHKLGKPDLIYEPTNLLYTCSRCNSRKGHLPIEEELQELGIGYLDPCLVNYEDHFEVGADGSIKHLSKSAHYMIWKLGLDGKDVTFQRRKRIAAVRTIPLILKARSRVRKLTQSRISGQKLRERKDVEELLRAYTDMVTTLLPRRLDTREGPNQPRRSYQVPEEEL